MKLSHGQPNNPKRHKLIREVDSAVAETTLLKTGRPAHAVAAKSSIKNIEDLRSALQTAIELEHSTIPPYLCALYSIKEGSNIEAASIIRSVVVEEMLHMVLAANILNAIGGKPKINSENFIPKYPGPLPDSDGSFEISLANFSRETIETFLKIEKPDPKEFVPRIKGYHTIGEFYSAVMIGLREVNDATPGGIFVADEAQKKRQITPEHYYGSGGEIIAVYSFDDAWKAIEEIVGQGEGIDGTIVDSDEKMFGQGVEYAHYFRFNEVLEERMYDEDDTPKSGPTGAKLPVDWDAVHDMVTNPKMKDFEGHPELYEKAKSFNQTYTLLLDNIHHACNGEPELLMKGIGLMYQLKYKAVALMNIPFEDGLMAGPTFELIDN